jgi:uncharacterized protein (DUF342 family)
MEQPIEATIRTGYNMDIQEKIDMLNSRIDMHKDNLAEHHRILLEDLPLSLDTDEAVVRSMIPKIEVNISALEEFKISIMTSLARP